MCYSFSSLCSDASRSFLLTARERCAIVHTILFSLTISIRLIRRNRNEHSDCADEQQFFGAGLSAIGSRVHGVLCENACKAH